MPSNIVISNEKHLHDVKLHTCHTTPHTILKNRMFLLYNSVYPTNRMLKSTIISLIVIHELNNLTLIPYI